MAAPASTTRRDFLHLAGLATGATVGMAVLPGVTGQFIEATDDGLVVHRLPAGGPVRSHIKPLFEEWWVLENMPLGDDTDPYWSETYYPRLAELEATIRGLPARTTDELAMQVIVETRNCAFPFDEPEFPERLRQMAGVA